jgi:hypothetical protein
MDATEKQTQDDDEIAHKTLLARGRLSEAKRWFAYRDWKVLPRGIRGQQILKWGADHAWLAAQTDQKRKRSVRNWCHRWDPRLSDAELDQIVKDTVNSNKRWSHDQSATVLEISVRDREAHCFRFFGAMDDPNYEIRHAVKREKAAARARKYRAANGAKPRTVYEANSLSRTKPWERDGISRRTWERRRKKADASASRHLNSISSVMHLRHSESEPPDLSRARQAPRRQAPIIIDTRDRDNLKASWGDVVDQIDDPEHAPFAGATGATKEPKMEQPRRQG